MSKIVAYYSGRFVTVYTVNGDFKKVYRDYDTEDCRAITYHEITKKDHVCINNLDCKTPHVHISRGIHDTSIATYYVDEIYQQYAGEIQDRTNEKKKVITY